MLAGSGEEFGAIGRAAIGEDTLDFDVMSFVEVEGLVQGVENAGDLFIGEQTSKGETGVIIDGDVETFNTGAWIAESAITSGADAGALETAQLLDIEVEKLAGMVAFVTHDRWFGRFQGREAVEVMAAQDARERGFGNWQDRHDLRVGAALAAERKDPGFELRAGLARLMMRDRRTVGQAGGKTAFPGAFKPASDGFLADGVSRSRGAQRQGFRREKSGHLGSRQRGEGGISVHVVRAVWRWVECSSTTSLHDASRADNVLKHDS